MLSAMPLDISGLLDRSLFSHPDLLARVTAGLNSSELARRRFREIARVAALVFSGFPGQPKSMRQQQASSSLFYDVFSKYDADNRLQRRIDRCWLTWSAPPPRMIPSPPAGVPAGLACPVERAEPAEPSGRGVGARYLRISVLFPNRLSIR